MTNSNKHVRLSLMAIAGCNATVIQLPWGVGLQIGDRGFESVDLQGTLAFIGSQGQRLEIRGPDMIDRNTISLANADPGINVVRRTWQEFKFDEFPHQPAIVFLSAVNTEVKRIVDRLVPLLSGS